MINLLMQSGVKRLKGKNLEENSKIANSKIARMGKKWQNKGFSTAFLGKSPPKMLLSY